MDFLLEAKQTLLKEDFWKPYAKCNDFDHFKLYICPIIADNIPAPDSDDGEVSDEDWSALVKIQEEMHPRVKKTQSEIWFDEKRGYKTKKTKVIYSPVTSKSILKIAKELYDHCYENQI